MAVTSEQSEVVRLRLICLAPPEQHADEATEFGLQDKQQVIHAGHRGAGGSISYDLEVRVTGSRGTNAPRFSGPFVQGTAAAPFLYLGWWRKEPPGSPWIRRLNIPLTAITREQIAAVNRAVDGFLEARINGNGGGTVPLLDGGWLPRATRAASSAAEHL